MKKNLVFIHGALGAASQFDELSQFLNQKFKVHVYEIPGHGKRAGENISFSIENFTQDFKSYLKQFNSPVNVFGFSMGGYISLYLAKSNPEFFEKIITLGTKFRWSVEESFKETQKLMIDVLKVKVPQYCDYLQLLHGNNWEKVVEETKNMMLGLGKNPLLNQLSCKEIKTNTVLLLGELDKMVTQEETALIQDSIQDSRFEILDGFVHPLEKLDGIKLAATIESFIG